MKQYDKPFIQLLRQLPFVDMAKPDGRIVLPQQLQADEKERWVRLVDVEKFFKAYNRGVQKGIGSIGDLFKRPPASRRKLAARESD